MCVPAMPAMPDVRQASSEPKGYEQYTGKLYQRPRHSSARNHTPGTTDSGPDILSTATTAYVVGSTMGGMGGGDCGEGGGMGGDCVP